MVADIIKHYLTHNALLPLILSLFLSASCSSLSLDTLDKYLLSIPVMDSQLISTNEISHRLVNTAHDSGGIDNPLLIISRLWFEPYARNTVALIDKTKDDSFDIYTSVLIFDNIPDDDSLSGYRYDIKLRKDSSGGWQVTEARKSWRCWQDRGHRYFSTEPCV